MPKTLISLFVICFLINFSNAIAGDFKSAGTNLTVEALTEQTDIIWGFDFLDENNIIFTERSGQIKTLNLKNNKVETISPLGGDELNLITKGANYGWPIVTYGREYTGEKIGDGSVKDGMTAPIAYWAPSISPSGIGFYFGDKIPKWKGNLFMGCLSGTHLRRLVFEGDKVVQQEELLKDMNLRFRNVRAGLDGWLYFSTDQGHIMRIKTKS